jgi:hypothetical protein
VEHRALTESNAIWNLKPEKWYHRWCNRSISRKNRPVTKEKVKLLLIAYII